jgi:predicted permease
VLLAAIGLSVLSGLFCGLAPALQGTRMDLVSGLKAADVDLPGRKWKWGRNSLVVAQIATSLMLLAASFLMTRGFEHSLGESTDFAISAKEHVLMAKFDPRLAQYDAEQTQQFYRRLVQQAKEIPGVENVGLTQNPPLGLDDFGSLAFVPEGFQMPRGRETFTTAMDTVDDGYFRAMGVSLLKGRGFTQNDDASAPAVVIVNEQFAQHYWPQADPIGKRIRLNGGAGPLAQVVGVAQAVKYGSTFEKAMDFVYLPTAQHPAPRLILLLRAKGNPRQLAGPVQAMVRRLDANLPIVEMRTYADIYHYAVVEGPGIAIHLVGTLGGVALFLAVAGLYGLIAYQVSRRTREIGIRMAIGARPADVLRLMMSKGLRLVVVGTVLGVAMGFAVERLLNAMIFTEAGFDITVFVVVVPLMALVTMLATYLPARRAARIPPTQAIRYE